MAQSSTQQFLEIEEIREGTVVLKNRSVRGVIMVSSLNFALKSDDEQQAIIYQFQNFLNSLDFPLEIVCQSRLLNLTGYIEKLKSLEQKQQNELLKMQTAEYRKFIQQLIVEGQILSKTFFVIVPFYPVTMGAATEALSGLFKSPTAAAKKPMDDEEFQRAKSQLWQRLEFTVLGLKRCGLQCVPLNTTELIELYWSLYHPEEAENGYYPEIPPEIVR